MMKRKSLISLFLCLAMMLAMAACSSSGGNVSTGGDSAATPPAGTSAPEEKTPEPDEDDGALIPVTIQLKWVQQAQFMGYYAAKELGIYEDFGLDVTIVPGGSVDVIDEVDSGRAQFGVSWVSTVMSAIANGANVMNVAQYYQNSGMTLVSLNGTVADPTVVSAGESTRQLGRRQRVRDAVLPGQPGPAHRLRHRGLRHAAALRR